MSAYRLEPIPTRLSDPAWQGSTISEAVWAGAVYPIEARELVAGRTADPLAPASACTWERSPWLDAELTTCVWQSRMDDVPLGTVRTIDNREL
jgi:hypothetical protein